MRLQSAVVFCNGTKYFVHNDRPALMHHSQSLPVAVTCAQLLVVIYKFWQQELPLLDLALSL